MKKRDNSLLVFILIITLHTGCVSPGTPCGDIPESQCKELIARYEITQGELFRPDLKVQFEIRNGEKGIWIGRDIFRVIAEGDIGKNEVISNHAAGLPCRKVTESDIKKAEKKVLHIFNEIHSYELYRREGMINYELSLLAAEKEIKSLIKTGTIITGNNDDGECRILFQVKARCLKNLIYTGNQSCE